MLSKPTAASSASRKATTSSSAKSAITAGSKKSTTTSLRKTPSRKAKVATRPLPFPSGDPRNKFVYTDRSMFDVEELAQREAKYYRIATDEAIYLSTDPVRRDQCLNELSKNPKVVNTMDAETIIGDLNPFDYLAWVDGELEKTPVAFEDHLLRLNFAWAAAFIFTEYVKYCALNLFPMAREAVDRRAMELDAEYVKGLKQNTSSGSTRIDTHPSPFSRSFSTGSNSTSSALSTTGSSSHSHITPQQADEWISNVLQSDLMRLHFRLLNADVESHNDATQAGTWSFKGVDVRKRKPVYQTTWTFSDGNSCLIPYDAQSFRALLINSEVAGEIEEEGDGDDV